MTTKRYLPPSALNSFLEGLPQAVSISTIGKSVKGLPISLLTIGNGKTKILMWSQMHGNESTTTRALLDFIPWFLKATQKHLQKTFTLSVILQLNPDGAKAYTRLNANGVDLNRDAIDLTQPESVVLQELYQEINPDYCLNLHGQRTIFSAGKMGKTASLSFLAPSADLERSITPSRKKAMHLIVALKRALEKELPEQVGRYDDAFNPNCVGDKFTQMGTPTILFEAGHVPEDYQREITRKYIFESYKTLLYTLFSNDFEYTTNEYFDIPENAKDYVDLIVSGVTIKSNDESFVEQELAIQYEERLEKNEVIFVPVMQFFASQAPVKAHKKIRIPKDLKNKEISFEKGKIIQKDVFERFSSI
jgi:hypothetical protein